MRFGFSLAAWTRPRIFFRLLLLVAVGPTAAPSPLEARSSPNILLILTDDQGWGDLGVHGNDLIDTPRLDELAGQGARFDRFFVSPVCAPTRAQILTGRYALRSGVRWMTRGWETIRADEVTLAEILREAGYATGAFGKWHNGAHYPYHPNGRGFDEFLGFSGGHWNLYFDPILDHNGSPAQKSGYITDVLTDAAIEFVERNRDRPFFAYVPYNVPHTPWQVPDRYFEKYKRRGLDDATACAYGMVENVDDNVGRLLEALERLGLAENTVVLFTSDNGPNSERFNGDMRGRKGSVHEGGVRVPLFVRFPWRIPPGTEVPHISADIDLLPTLLELAGIGVPEGVVLDGESLVPLLEGRERNGPERLLFSHFSPGGEVRPTPGAVRTRRWRAVNTGEGWQLYDMSSDPGEGVDVAERRPEVVKRLADAYREWFEDVTRAGFEPVPIPVGHSGRSLVELPAHEATLRQAEGGSGIDYVRSPGWANYWISHWTRTDAYPWWELEVVRPGRYEVSIQYVCPERDVGSRVRVEVGGRRLEAVVARPHDPPPLPSPDHTERPGSFYVEKIWADLPLGVVKLEAGRTRIVVRAVKLAGSEVMELKSVRLRRLEDVPAADGSSGGARFSTGRAARR